ncbi:phage tail tape measure C-terminal domain-containing protein [Geminicoccaceae bacterium 1502E]|nr:phage tail tape measure C-terminal domain-containing protein [Geminicoccaceae bacterium 1502E]
MPANQRLNFELAAQDRTAQAFNSASARIVDIDRKFARSARAANDAGRAYANAGRMSGHMRNGLGQLGFQVQDIATQLEMGTNPLRVFVQQGGQIAGAFGPVGAIIGAVGAAVGVAAGAFLGFRSDVEDAARALEAAGKAHDSFADTIVGRASDVDDYRKVLAELNAEQREFARLDILASQRELEKALQGIRDAATGIFDEALDDLQTPLLRQADQLARNMGVAIDQEERAFRDLAFGVEALIEAFRAGEQPLEDTVLGINRLIQGSDVASERLADWALGLRDLGTETMQTEEQLRKLEAGLALLDGRHVPNVGTVLGEGADNAGRLSDNMRRAADEAERMRKAQEDAELQSLMKADMAVWNALGAQRKREHEEFVKAQEEAAEKARKLSPMPGLEAGLAKVAADAQDVAGQIEGAVTGAFDHLEDKVASFVMTGKLELDDLARSAAAAFAQFGAGQLSGAVAGGLRTALFGAADGAVMAAGNPVGFAKGGLPGGPTIFPMPGGRMGIMNEGMDEEAIMPLARGPDGKLGVRAHGSGGGEGNMTVVNNIDARGAISPGAVAMIARAESDRGVRRALSSLPRKRRSPLGI